MNWFDTTLVVVIYFSYTNGSHEKFCWVLCDWSFQVLGYLTMDEGRMEETKLGDARHPKLFSKNEQPTKLGGAPSGIPAFFQRSSVFYSKLYFYSSHDMCFAWRVLYDLCLCFFILCFKSSNLAGHTYLREPKLCHDLSELLSMLHLIFLWAMDLL